MVDESKYIQDIWTRGWLKNKEYCFNPFHKHYNPLIDTLIKNLNMGLNNIIIVVGTPRSGKSYFSFWLQAYMNWCYFGREEYKPEKENIAPINDIYWGLDSFMNATKDPRNQNKFITLEEMGVENYKFSYFDQSSQSFDKLNQLFGVDNTNLILNLPYIFDILKSTRLKAGVLVRVIKRSKNVVNVTLCKKWLNMVTDKAGFSPVDTWEKVPNVADIYPAFVSEYMKRKLEYNLKKKNEFTYDKHEKHENNEGIDNPVANM